MPGTPPLMFHSVADGNLLAVLLLLSPNKASLLLNNAPSIHTPRVFFSPSYFRSSTYVCQESTDSVILKV